MTSDQASRFTMAVHFARGSEISSFGVYPFLHICGNATHLLSNILSISPACIELDAATDFKCAMEKLSDSIIIRGNVDTINLLGGPPELIIEEVKNCMKIAGNRGFILSPGCGVPKETPKEHILALVEAAKRFCNTQVPIA